MVEPSQLQFLNGWHTVNGEAPAREDADDGEDDEAVGDERESAPSDGLDEDRPKKRRRRGGRRRRGRGRGEGDEGALGEDGELIDEAVGEQIAESIAVVAEPVEAAEAPVEEAPKKRTRRKKADVAEQPAEAEAAAASEPDTAAEPVAEKPKRTRKKKVEAEPVVETAPEPVAEEAAPAEKPKRTRKKKVEAEAVTAEPASTIEPAADNDANGVDETAETRSKRGGWWQRTFGE